MRRMQCQYLVPPGVLLQKQIAKMVLYYTFLLTNTIKKLEPLPLLEVLTNSYYEKPIKWCLDAFLKDEKERYGHNVSSIPLIFTCDVSWPIIKPALRVFNNELIEEYCRRSYTIATGNATSKELPTIVSKTFIQLRLSHVMNSFSRRSERYFKRIERTFVIYCCSLLANTDTWVSFKETFHHIIVVLLSPTTNSDYHSSYIYLKQKISKIGEDELCENMDNETIQETGEYLEQIDATTSEDKVLQQSKRSKFFRECSLDFINVKKLVENIDIEGGMENQLYSPEFSAYLLNNWTGLASFWINVHLNNQLKHGTGEAYLEWSKNLVKD